MAKGVYLGVGGVRQSKKIYVGVGGVRKVKKIFVGAGGVKLAYSGDITYLGTTTALSQTRYCTVGGSVGDYALFTGGSRYQNSTFSESNIVDGYSSSLVRVAVSGLSYPSDNHASATIGNYAIFAGGQGSGTNPTQMVQVYNSSLVKSSATYLNGSGARSIAGATVGDYALFAGGDYLKTVYAYTSSLVRSLPIELNQGISNMTGATVGDYALFAGGRATGSVEKATVYAYSSSLIKSFATALTTATYGLASASGSKYALFGAGNRNPSVLQVYNSSLVKTNADALSTQTGRGTDWTATYINGFYLFSGFHTSEICEAYDDSLIKTPMTAPSKAGQGMTFAKAGESALLGGGLIGLTMTGSVDVYGG